MSNRAVLISIKPKYADLIFAGTKTIDLRRVCPKVCTGDLVLVYVSSPRMASWIQTGSARNELKSGWCASCGTFAGD